MEKQVNTKPIHKFCQWRYVAVFYSVLAVILMIGCSSANEDRSGGSLRPVDVTPEASNNETASDTSSDGTGSPKTLYFPRADGSAARIQIPLHTTLAQLHVDSGDGSVNTAVPSVPEMTFALAQEMESQIEATLVYRPDIGGGYLLLSPTGWQASAIVGANGSYGVTFQDPKNPEQNLNYSDNAWGCAGCAINGIGTYFPEKAEWADEMGFTVYEPLKFIEQHTMGNTGAELRTVRYTLPADPNGYMADGAAYYEEVKDGYLFRNMEIHLSQKSPQQELVDTIMNFFTVNHGPLNITGS